MLGVPIATILHLMGIIFWIGGMAARLLLISSAKSGTSENVRSQLHQIQRGIHFMMEIPGSVITILAGGFLINAAQVNFHLPWFRAKISLVIGLIVIEFLASRQIKAFTANGRAGSAIGLFASLVIFTLLTLVAVITKF
jgi:uncharacterized membrane protein